MNSFSFTSPLMEILCREMQDQIVGSRVVACFPNNPKRFFLLLQGDRGHKALLFCFIPSLIRFHLSTSLPPVPKLPFRHPLDPFLKESILIHASVVQQDRILELVFKTPLGQLRLIGEFFPRHPNYYLVDSDGKILYSLFPSSSPRYQLPAPPITNRTSFSPSWSCHSDVEEAFFAKEFQDRKHAIQLHLRKEIGSLEKKEQKLLEQLKRCEDWAKVQHEGDLIKTHLGSIKKGNASVKVFDWETNQSFDLPLDPSKGAQEQMAARYKEARKLLDGKEPLLRHLAETQAKLSILQEKEAALHAAEKVEELVEFESEVSEPRQTRKKDHAGKEPSLPYREFVSSTGMKILVGKNAKGNEILTFKVANGRDWWLHASGCAGSHVVIRLGNAEEPDSETLKKAFQLALYYSKGRNLGEGEVCYTQRKFVARLGQSRTGQVQISAQKTAWVRLE